MRRKGPAGVTALARILRVPAIVPRAGYAGLSLPALLSSRPGGARRIAPADTRPGSSFPRTTCDAGDVASEIGLYQTLPEESATPEVTAGFGDVVPAAGKHDEAIPLLTPRVRSSSANPCVGENLPPIYGLMGDAVRAAVLSRSDLDDYSTGANLEYLVTVRGGRS